MKKRATLPAVVPAAVRRSEIWNRLTEILSEFDVTARVGRASRHYYLETEVGHTPHKHFFGVNAGPRALRNNTAELRRVVLRGRANLRRIN